MGHANLFGSCWPAWPLLHANFFHAGCGTNILHAPQLVSHLSQHNGTNTYPAPQDLTVDLSRSGASQEASLEHPDQDPRTGGAKTRGPVVQRPADRWCKDPRTGGAKTRGPVVQRPADRWCKDPRTGGAKTRGPVVFSSTSRKFVTLKEFVTFHWRDCTEVNLRKTDSGYLRF